MAGAAHRKQGLVGTTIQTVVMLLRCALAIQPRAAPPQQAEAFADEILINFA
jgi:hypothetical protein